MLKPWHGVDEGYVAQRSGVDDFERSNATGRATTSKYSKRTGTGERTFGRGQSKVDLQHVSLFLKHGRSGLSPFTLPRFRRCRRRSGFPHARPRLQPIQNTRHILGLDRLDFPSALNDVSRICCANKRDLRSEPLLERLRDEIPVRREPLRERRGELDRLPCLAVCVAASSG